MDSRRSVVIEEGHMARQPDRSGRRPILQRRQLEDLIFRKAPLRRFTQDSPILPDVWFEYGRDPDVKVDLLLTPVRDSSPGEVFKAVRRRLDAERKTAHWRDSHGGEPQSANLASLAYSQSTVAVRLWFDELVRVVIPLSAWQNEYDTATRQWIRLDPATTRTAKREPAEALVRLERGDGRPEPHDNAVWMIAVIGTIGQPERVKQILCATATDLGRERYFQGCGMVDVLRAIQSV
jgi:hypothetical protein